MGYTEYIVTFLLGILSSVLYFEWKKYRQNRADLKALLVLAFARISVFHETLQIIFEEPTSNVSIWPPTLGIDSKQAERLFVLSKNKDLVLFIARTEAVCAFYQSMNQLVKIKPDKQLDDRIIQDCEKCLKNIYTIFEKEFSSREAMYYLRYDDATDNGKHIP